MTLQSARIIWLAFLVSVGLIIAVAHSLVKSQTHSAPAPAFSYAIAGVAVAQFIFLTNLRRRLLERSRSLSERGEAPAAQAIWSLAQLFGFATAESLVLFGFVLHTMGAQPLWISTTLFVAGPVVLIAFYPQLTEPTL